MVKISQADRVYTRMCSEKMAGAREIGINPLSPELNPICYLLALLAHDFLHVSRIRVK
jgi:transposase